MSAITRQAISIGTNQTSWKTGLPKGITGAALCTNSNAAAVSDYAHIVPTPKTAVESGSGASSQASALPVAVSLANGVFPIKVPELSNRMNFKFYLSDADDETMTARVFGLNRLQVGNACEWIGEHLGSLAITAGSKAVNPSSQILPPVGAGAGEVTRWADTITPTDDSFNDSWEVFSDAANGAAIASVDSFGYEWIVVVLAVGTCEGMGFIWQEK